MQAVKATQATLMEREREREGEPERGQQTYCLFVNSYLIYSKDDLKVNARAWEALGL